MRTIEIPRDAWNVWFQNLSDLYQGTAVTIEVLSCDLGDQFAADGLPLQGLSFETEGSYQGDILVEVGDIEPGYLMHHIDQPRCVRVVDTRPGIEADMQIESADGMITLIRLRRLPELPSPEQGGFAQM